MASKGTKGFIAIFVIVVGLLVVNFSIFDISTAVGKAWLTIPNGKPTTGNNTKDKNCGKVVQLDDCKDCQKHQLANLQKYPECAETGKRQKSKCSRSKFEFHTSCRINEERKFWIFQISALVLGCLSSLVVWCRSKHLDEHVLGKIRKQIGTES